MLSNLIVKNPLSVHLVWPPSNLTYFKAFPSVQSITNGPLNMDPCDYQACKRNRRLVSEVH